MDAKTPIPSPARRRFTFGMRSLLGAVTLLAIAFAVIGEWTYGKVQQGIAINHFSRIGVHLATDDGFPLVIADVIRLETPANAQVADKDLAWLRLVPTMQVVWLEDTNVSDAGLPYLRSLPKLRWLDLSRTRVTDVGLVEIGRFENLEWLVLDGTAITDEGLEQLLGLKKLNVLSLEHTAISDAAIPLIGKLAPFSDLRLAGTQISKDGIARLQRAMPETLIE